MKGINYLNSLHYLLFFKILITKLRLVPWGENVAIIIEQTCHSSNSTARDVFSNDAFVYIMIVRKLIVTSQALFSVNYTLQGCINVKFFSSR